MTKESSQMTTETSVPNVSSSLYAMTRNNKGNEYAGSRFQMPPRPERFKRYEGSYQRLKTGIQSQDQSCEVVGLQLVERVLMTAYGITSVKFYGYQSEMVWTVPSAGGCYPFEIYLVIRNAEGMRPGVYYFSAINASLYYITGKENTFLLNESLLPEDRDADFYIVSTIIPWRSCWKYSLRGYRFAYIDTGHLLCNFQLVAEALNLYTKSYTHVQAEYLKSLIHADENEEPVSIICFKSQKENAPLIENRRMQDHVVYCRNLPDANSNETDYDWAMIGSLKHQIGLETKGPSSSWLLPFRATGNWTDAATLSRLLFQRRSCSAFLRTSIPKHKFDELVCTMKNFGVTIKCYAVIHAVDEMRPGLYVLRDDRFELMKEGFYRRHSTGLCLDQQFVYNSAALIFFAVDLESLGDKPVWTQLQRLIDAGSLSQLLYLKCEEAGLGYSAIGGYYDVESRELFGAGENIEFIYAGVVGKEDRNAGFQIKMDRYYLNKPKTGMEKSSIPRGESRVITDKLEQCAAKYADRIAIIYDNIPYTYQEMWERIEWYGDQAREKITNQYPVGICMKNHPNYLFVYYGLLKNGFIPMLLDSTLTQEEIKLIKDSYHLGSLITIDSGDVVHYKIYDDIYADYNDEEFIDVATCRFSSGTTGRPKCLMFTFDAILSAAMNWKKSAGITGTDRVLCTALFHNGLAFNTSLLSVFLTGACLIINKNISPKYIWEIVRRHEATILIAFPVVYDMLNKSQYCSDSHQLRLCISSSAPLHYTIKQTFEENTGMKICDYYGIVEAGPATFNDGTVPDSLGRPIEGVQIRIVDKDGKEVYGDEAGTLQIKSTSMAKGYYHYPASYSSMVTPDGYYQTSDRGFMRGGYLYVVGRDSDIINVAGKKVDPTEVESTILKMAGVQDVAVIGISNQSLTSEYPVAYVVCDANITSRMIIKHCQEKLAPYKLPQKVILVPAIPRSGVGKIKRRELSDQFYTVYSE